MSHAAQIPSESVTVQIVEAIAAETDRDPKSIPPLYNAIDPDALETLMNRPAQLGPSGSAVEVEFEIAECRVTVSSVEGVQVVPLQAPPGNMEHD